MKLDLPHSDLSQVGQGWLIYSLPAGLINPRVLVSHTKTHSINIERVEFTQIPYIRETKLFNPDLTDSATICNIRYSTYKQGKICGTLNLTNPDLQRKVSLLKQSLETQELPADMKKYAHGLFFLPSQNVHQIYGIILSPFKDFRIEDFLAS